MRVAPDSCLSLLPNPRSRATRHGWLIASGLVVTCVTAWLAGCAVLGYEKAFFATADVRLVHSDIHCNATAAGLADAELVVSRLDGIGRLAATRAAWEFRARQLATELGGDVAVMRPCTGEYTAMEFKQIEVWRTQGYAPTVHEEPAPPGMTLTAPPGAGYATRLQHVDACLEHAYAARVPPPHAERARLPAGDLTAFFSSGRHFPGYAQLDRHYQPTRAIGPSLSEPLRDDVPRLSMTLARRDFADWAAGRYLALPPEGRAHFA
ncbi:MAG TPA: hypothetical protein VIX81_09815, partial [Gammaproteobacteria bacterium]